MLSLLFLIRCAISNLDTEEQSYTFVTNQKTKITLSDPNIYLKPQKDSSFHIFNKKTKEDTNVNKKEFYYVHFSHEDVNEIQKHIELESKRKMLKDTYLLYLSKEQLQKISDISLVKRLEPEDKILNFGGAIKETNYLLVTTAPDTTIPENSQYYTVESNWYKDTYVVRIDSDQPNNKKYLMKKQKALEILSNIPSIERISTYKKPEIMNNVATGYTQRNNKNFTIDQHSNIQKIDRYMNNHNITGKGEIITVIDTLIDIYHSMFYDQNVPVIFNRPLLEHRKFAYYGYHFDIDNWTKTITAGEHGTHVSGTAAGNNNDCPSFDATQGPELFNGNAPDAKILYAGLLNNVSVQEQIDLMFYLNSKISTNSWGVDGFNDDINFLYGDASYLMPNSIFIYAAGNSYEKFGNFSVSDPGGSKNVLTVGALGSFYDTIHIYYIRNYKDPNLYMEVFSLVDPEPYMMGTIGAKELGSDIVVIDGGASNNSCSTIDVPQVSLIFATSAEELEWMFGCDIQQSNGILYTYDLQGLENLINAESTLIYMQDATPYNHTLNVTHAPYSSTGPANKGILKPDLMAPGTRIISAKSENHSNMFHGCIITDGNAVTFMQGTSMATPNAAGAAALVRQYIRTNWPTQSVDLDGPTVRALLINSCIQQPVGTRTPNIMFGHGQIDLSTVLPVENDFGVQITHQQQNEQPSITEFSQRVSKLNVKSNNKKLQITMSYLDPLISPTSYIPLTRDLDLMVVSKSGRIFLGDHLPNNSTQHFSTNEKVIINEDEIEPGEYEIRIYSLDFIDVPDNGSSNVFQNFSVVATGDIDNGFLVFSTPKTCGCEKCDIKHPLHCACDGISFGENCQTHINEMNETLQVFNLSVLEIQLVRINSDKSINSIGLFTEGFSAETVQAYADTDCHLNIGSYPVSVNVGRDKHADTSFDFNSTSICLALFNNFYQPTSFTVERDYVAPPPDDGSKSYHHKKKLSGGAIAGIVIGCCAAAAIIITVSVCCVKKNSIKDF